MRLVRRDYTKKPRILDSNDVQTTLNALLKSNDPTIIRESLYQDPYVDTEGKRQMRVRDELNIYYLGKCAYCETDCKAEIEHYRPKKRVTDDLGHNGYYWLCYEWSNLLPSCHDCNTAGGKGNKFPIKGIRVSDPPRLPGGLLDSAQMKPNKFPLLQEQPYLLHPEFDDPSLFIGVEVDPKGEGLKLQGLDGANQRGDQTIQICNLNRLDSKLNRLRVINQTVNMINTVFSLLVAGHLSPENLKEALQIHFEQLDCDASDHYQEHTLLRRYMIATVAQFEQLIVQLLEPSQQQLVLTAFIDYRSRISV